MSEQQDPFEVDENPEARLEDEFGQPDEGDSEAEGALDTEVTDEDTDEALGLEDTDAEDATSAELSAAEGDEGPDEDDADAEAEAEDPLEAFRRELWAKPGDWFVVHTYSGMENRVKSNLENRIISLNMEDYIHEIVVPTEEVAEIKNGQRKMVKRTVLPGYVLVRMDLTDESWAAVRHTPSVTGFVGHSHQPVPLSMSEVESMLAPAVVAQAEAEAARWLATLGLADAQGRRPGELSGGQAQRVAVARALVTRPEVVFADEPTGSLDQTTGHDVMSLLVSSTRAVGASLVVVTHDADVAAWCDRRIDMRDGLVVPAGSTTGGGVGPRPGEREAHAAGGPRDLGSASASGALGGGAR